MFAKTILLSVIFVLLSACTAPTESPAPVATLTATISPTETSTPAPTSTPTPEPTATPEAIHEIRMYEATTGDPIPFVVFAKSSEARSYVEENALMQTGDRFRAIDFLTASSNEEAVKYIRGVLKKVKGFVPKYGFASNWTEEKFFVVSVNQGPNREALITFVNKDGEYETVVYDDPDNPNDIDSFSHW